MTSTVERRSLPAQVAADLHGRIVAGDFAPGSQLPHQRDLAARYGVSAAVMREALARLKAAGLVTSKAGHGTFVSNQPIEAMRFPTWVRQPVGPGELAQAIEARDVLEHATAVRAAQRRSKEDISTLRAIIGRMEESADEVEAFIATDVALHLAVAAAARNQVLAGALAALQRSLSETVSVGVQDAIDNEWMPTLIRTHVDLVDAIEQGDAQSAGERMEVMFARLRTIVEKTGIVVDPWPR
jgi:GntR family transcriptional repressor for pyruvate dehydrogenase complex